MLKVVKGERMTRMAFTFFAALALLVSGCSPAATTVAVTPTLASTPSLPAADEGWAIRMTHSGGIMGLMRSVEVSSDGSFTVTDERAGKTVTGKLADNELAQLSELIAASENAAMQGPGLGVCADCFIYALEIQSGENKLIVQLDDITLPESGMETLVKFLRGIMDAALK